jgi:ABC-2 family transporter protein
MTCLLWRQHRGQLLWTVVVLGFAGLATAVVAHSADHWLGHYHQWLAQLRAAGCPLRAASGTSVVHAPSPACHALLARYPGGLQASFAKHYNFAIPVLEEGVVLILVIVGVLVGAPLVAREVEQRTQLVAWSQSIPRRRWYTTKTIVLAAVLAVAGLVAGLANDQAQIPLTRGGLTSSRWPWFFSIDVAPAAETVLAFALAVAIGAYLRRTLPAIGAALVAFLVLFVLTGWAVRSLTPLSRATGTMRIRDTSWLVGGGQYHPASQYWPLQLTYVAILLGLAGLLLVAGWRATRPRNVV